MLKNKYDLLSHIKICFQIFLHRSGDSIISFMENIIDFKTLTLEVNEPSVLSEIFNREISKKFKNSEIFNNISILESFKFSKFKNLDLRFAINNIEYAFCLNYSPISPVNFCFTNKINFFYNDIFKKLFKWKIYQNLNSRIFSVLKDFNNKKISDGNLMKMWMILHRAFNIMNSLLNFIFCEVNKKFFIYKCR